MIWAILLSLGVPWVSDVFAWARQPGSVGRGSAPGDRGDAPGRGSRRAQEASPPGDDSAIATLALADCETCEVAAGHAQRAALLGRFATADAVQSAPLIGRA